MSLRIDTAEWLPGALLIGNTGGGVLGQSIPSGGSNGAAYVYNDLVLPADNTKEICGRITTWPTQGTLTAFEDTSFSYIGASDSFGYQLYVDLVAVGAPTTVTLAMGAGFSGAISTANSVVSASASVTPPAGAAPVATLSVTTADALFNALASSSGAPVLALPSAYRAQVPTPEFGAGAILAKFIKQPTDVLDYDIDYNEWLRAMSDTGMSCVVVVDDGITLTAFALAQGVVKLWLSGGVHGAIYKVTATLTSTGGRVLQSEIMVKVIET